MSGTHFPLKFLIFAANGSGFYGGPITLTSYIWEKLGTACPTHICRPVELPDLQSTAAPIANNNQTRH